MGVTRVDSCVWQVRDTCWRQCSVQNDERSELAASCQGPIHWHWKVTKISAYQRACLPLSKDHYTRKSQTELIPKLPCSDPFSTPWVFQFSWHCSCTTHIAWNGFHGLMLSWVEATKRFRWCKIDQPPMIFRHTLAVRKLVQNSVGSFGEGTIFGTFWSAQAGEWAIDEQEYDYVLSE